MGGRHSLFTQPESRQTRTYLDLDGKKITYPHFYINVDKIVVCIERTILRDFMSQKGTLSQFGKIEQNNLNLFQLRDNLHMSGVRKHIYGLNFYEFITIITHFRQFPCQS